eukprot:5337895-Pleurochrysis_carterae.AAC.1
MFASPTKTGGTAVSAAIRFTTDSTASHSCCPLSMGAVVSLPAVGPTSAAISSGGKCTCADAASAARMAGTAASLAARVAAVAARKALALS